MTEKTKLQIDASAIERPALRLECLRLAVNNFEVEDVDDALAIADRFMNFALTGEWTLSSEE